LKEDFPGKTRSEKPDEQILGGTPASITSAIVPTSIIALEKLLDILHVIVIHLLTYPPYLFQDGYLGVHLTEF